MNAKSPHLYPIILHAAKSNSMKCIDIVLKAGADVNAYHPDRFVDITVFDEVTSPECLGQLIDAGADVNLRCDESHSHLIEAIIYDKVECAKLMISCRSQCEQW